MATITVKNIPDNVYDTLKQLAASHHRSINSEIIYLVEKFTGCSRYSPEDHLDMARKMRNKTKKVVSLEEISDAINEGRS